MTWFNDLYRIYWSSAFYVATACIGIAVAKSCSVHLISKHLHLTGFFLFDVCLCQATNNTNFAIAQFAHQKAHISILYEQIYLDYLLDFVRYFLFSSKKIERPTHHIDVVVNVRLTLIASENEMMDVK